MQIHFICISTNISNSNESKPVVNCLPVTTGFTIDVLSVHRNATNIATNLIFTYFISALHLHEWKYEISFEGILSITSTIHGAYFDKTLPATPSFHCTSLNVLIFLNAKTTAQVDFISKKDFVALTKIVFNFTRAIAARDTNIFSVERFEIALSVECTCFGCFI